MIKYIISRIIELSNRYDKWLIIFMRWKLSMLTFRNCKLKFQANMSNLVLHYYFEWNPRIFNDKPFGHITLCFQERKMSRFMWWIIPKIYYENHYLTPFLQVEAKWVIFAYSLLWDKNQKFHTTRVSKKVFSNKWTCTSLSHCNLWAYLQISFSVDF